MLSWDRGTLVLPPDAPAEGLPGVVWDPRTRCWRAPAWRYRELAAAAGARLVDTSPVPLPVPPLRSYQQTALDAWDAAGRCGIVVLPTGAGKTRTALAAIARSGLSALCVVPTVVLAAQWREALRQGGIGAVGHLADGERDVRRVTVATAASARLHADRLGDRFALLVVDECHHHGGADETLELYAAPARLGLTATPPEDPTALARLERLVGPVVFRVAIDELAGTFLADYDLVQLPLELAPDEAARYADEMARFRAFHAAWSATAVDRSWAALVRDAARSEEGRAAFAAWRRARARVAWPPAKDQALGALLDAHRHARVLVFTQDNTVAYTIARRHLVAPLTCDTGRAERDALLRHFSDGTLRALVSARVLNEGVDVPAADVAILTGGSHGAREYVQRIGRVLRPSPGKRALVVELAVRDTFETRQSERNRSRLAAS